MPGMAAKLIISERQQEVLQSMVWSRSCPQGLAHRAAIIVFVVAAFDAPLGNPEVCERTTQTAAHRLYRPTPILPQCCDFASYGDDCMNLRGVRPNTAQDASYHRAAPAPSAQVATSRTVTSHPSRDSCAEHATGSVASLHKVRVRGEGWVRRCCGNTSAGSARVRGCHDAPLSQRRPVGRASREVCSPGTERSAASRFPHERRGRYLRGSTPRGFWARRRDFGPPRGAVGPVVAGCCRLP